VAAAPPAPKPTPAAEPAGDSLALLTTCASLARTLLGLEVADAELAAARAALKAAADVPPVAETIPLAATTPLESAKAASQAWTSKQVAATLQEHAKAAVLEEVDGLSAVQLRERVLQLSNELSVRSKWEAMHLIDMLSKADERWSAMVRACRGTRAATHSHAHAHTYTCTH